ncbi:TPA: 30S ribosomal protein S9 [candidate division CPR2 bacterium]|uniref:Small ribosomal subunit protein uS9 n=1 Tax=candidate division CPR2 bacterium GW2011_GWC1_41_48 TaxID=1618344 RepID=A0A0G0Z753_UNCC2|nr:MAG: 30S ribosomal protein S9 [candidate division CPR2 bacterium GW2011_GWC2_39_35]KKR27177.1 MAG: 30S ribosomal protein S9 [candidate division CPR2 bacterium GW2011_GWD2_39_7]KKR29187.1 MAG: 30S ribosomal protein S9 [candidate division CPR2 bacterium GW2011_GWD1_39_7]KKS08863.1 MAG: 30S ribosomal protein S9 [candidate division CPR2 bacterium GW2011_GWC1_41_48]OGB62167.1 MAG: 30S ribosomal protein S9 [candidate division CPR2 bacterium GWD1_39_7]OGB70326.1 MAG: 30S ribosomal protein S9 [cand
MVKEPIKQAKKEYYYGLGRRKEAVARVRLYSGKGTITINDKNAVEDAFFSKILLDRLIQPLKLTGTEGKFDISIKADGGGKTGQAEAVRLGISRALLEFNPEFRPTLKKAGFLTRDPREKERKKYGLKRARKAPQFAKR